MWGEAVYTAAYLINRSPTRALKMNKTPAELWFGKVPDVSKLRIFGCKAYSWIPSQKRSKFDKKSKEHVMVGYAPNGYRLWNQAERKIVVSRDVKFDENVFPMSDVRQTDDQTDEFVSINLNEASGGISNDVLLHEDVESVTQPVEVPVQQLRRSSRNRREPERLIYAAALTVPPNRNNLTDFISSQSAVERSFNGNMHLTFNKNDCTAGDSFVKEIVPNSNDVMTNPFALTVPSVRNNPTEFISSKSADERSNHGNMPLNFNKNDNCTAANIFVKDVVPNSNDVMTNPAALAVPPNRNNPKEFISSQSAAERSFNGKFVDVASKDYYSAKNIFHEDDLDATCDESYAYRCFALTVPICRNNTKEFISSESADERSFNGKFLDDNSKEFLTAKDSPLEPEKYGEIFKRQDCKKWMQAVNDEITSLKENQTWRLVKRTVEMKPLTAKWVFKLKENGDSVKYKARLVARGFLQKYGIDNTETYAPVAKLATIRIILAVGMQHNFKFHQMDVKTAFLNGELSEEVYMEIPEGVENVPGYVCKLEKSLYGLKQSPKCWNEKFNKFMIENGFKRSKHDYCLYVKEGSSPIFVILYVDDLLIVSPSNQLIENLKSALNKSFKMTDCGSLKYFLGMEFVYDKGSLRISQTKSIEKVLCRFGMETCNPSHTPMDKNCDLQRSDLKVNQPYRELIGCLMYLMLCTRPDICFVIGYLSRYQEYAGEEHWVAAKRVLRYLKGTLRDQLIYKKRNEPVLRAFADSDWASCKVDRKSVSGCVIQVYGNTVSWFSKKQQTVATSSSEAEYIALSSVVGDVIWVKGILQDLHEIDENYCAKVYEDNMGCIAMATTTENKRVKHIDIRYHFTRDMVERKEIEIVKIPSEQQLADPMTKALDKIKFLQFKEILLN